MTTDRFFWEEDLPAALNRLRSLAQFPMLVGLLLVSCWSACVMAPAAWLRAAASVACLVVSVWLLSGSWRDWFAAPHLDEARAAFTAWREHIPPDAEVLWDAGAAETWLQLGRSSYLSASQSAVVLFSRPAALECARRARELSPPAQYGQFMGWGRGDPTFLPGDVPAICARSRVDFLIVRGNPVVPAIGMQPAGSRALRNLHLYRCTDLRVDL